MTNDTLDTAALAKRAAERFEQSADAEVAGAKKLPAP